MRFSLIDEMNEVPRLLRGFDPACVGHWVPALDAVKRILLTGEGSSRIFPAKNLIDRAHRMGKSWHLYTEGARQAAEYDLSDTALIGLSNSGRTKELVELLQKSKTSQRFGVTATANSLLSGLCDDTHALACGPEQATAATKSVVEQALVLQSLLQGGEWQYRNKAADLCEAILKMEIPAGLIDKIAQAGTVYFAGRNNGVAEELTLKTNEITRQNSDYLEGTYAVHGIEEVMDADDVVIWIDPFEAEWEKIKKTLVDGVGLTVIAIAAKPTIFPTVSVPSLDGFDAYFQLLAGWRLLVAAGLRRGVNLDKPLRARKVGNEV
jgi:glucosamine--fructose-6-phosphate aminotransferase (isomerizing)